MRRKAWLGGVLGVTALVLLLRVGAGGAGAAGPSTIARGLPGGATAYLEADDLGQLLQMWVSDSTLRKSWSGSAADEAYQKTFVYLRLVERLGKLGDAAGITIDTDALTSVFVRGGGVALYDVSDTEFVAEAQLSAAELASTSLADALAKLPHRTYAGLDYVVAGDKDLTLLVAQLGARLVVSNDVDRFHEALLLAAREEKVKTDGTAPGASIADDAVYAGLEKAAPASAKVRVYVKLTGLRGTHQFDDFWIFGKTSRRLDGVDAAMLALTLEKSGVKETRLYAYLDPARLATTVGARVDVAKTAAKLPTGGLWVGTELTDGGLAAERVARLLPSEHRPADDEEPTPTRRHVKKAAPSDEAAPDAGAPAAPVAAKTPVTPAPVPLATSGVAAQLAPLFKAAGATRMLEIVTVEAADPATALAQVRRGGAVAVRLATPAKLDRAALEKVLTDELHDRLAAGTSLPLAFADAGPPLGMRAVAVPFVAEWGVTLAYAGANGEFVIIATDAKLAARMVGELTRADGAATLLADGAPTASRLDLAAATRSWKAFDDVLTTREDFADSADKDFVDKLVTSALDAASGSASTVATAGWAEGGYGVEEMVAR